MATSAAFLAAARPEVAAVYGALDMPWAILVGQISKASGK